MRPAELYDVTWQGVLLAAAGQVLVLLALSRAERPAWRSLGRSIALVLAADAAVVSALFLLSTVFLRLNYGNEHHRVQVIIAHLVLAAIVPWAAWSWAISRALGRALPWSGAVMAAVTAVGLSVPGLWLSSSTRPAQVTQVTVRLPRLPRQLDGVRIAVVSDLHLGGRASAEARRARLRPLQHVRADLVVFLGDLVSEPNPDPATAARILAECAPKGAHRLAVLGNHERWTDEKLAVAELTKAGFAPLVNASERAKANGADLWVVGVNDPYTGADRLDKALSGVPGDAFVLLLAHSPDILRRPLSRRADLVLAGHTHGGQVVFPLIGPIAASSWYGARYAAGLFGLGHTRLFVTRGLGEVVVPFRLHCPPEIAVLELRAG
jgi:hypothetical protein